MKVIMVDSLTGNDYTLCLCSGLSKAGMDVNLVVPENREIRMPVDFEVSLWSPSKEQGQSKLKKAFRYVNYLKRVLNVALNREEKVFHYQFFRRKSDAFFFVLLRMLGANLVFTAHNVLPHEKSKIDYFLQKIVYKSANVIVVHSQYIKDKLLRNFKVDSEKIKIIPHGNFDVYLPDEEITKCGSRKELGLSDTGHVILFFGYIREYKGLDLLLDAFEIAAKEDERLTLVIAGQPYTEQLGEQYRQRIDQIPAKNRIHFHAGFVPSEKIATYFTASDIVVLPYRSIDHSGIVHLAYSFGRPMIATRVGDLDEVIEHGKSGYILERQEAEYLTESIKTAFRDEKKLEEMGEFSRELSDTKYSWDNIALKSKTVYQNILNHRQQK